MALWEKRKRKKIPLKASLSSFSVRHLWLCMACILLSIGFCFHSEAPLEKTKVSFASGYQLQIDRFWLRVGVYVHLSFQLEDTICCTAQQLLISVSSHVLLYHHLLAGLVPLVSSIPSGSYILFASSFTGLSCPEERDLMETAHLTLSIIRSPSLYIMSDCGSLCLSSFAGESFSDEDWTRHWFMIIADKN